MLNPRRLCATVGVAFVAALGVTVPGHATPGGMITGAHEGLAYKLHVPKGRTTRAPLVVMLHGCTQDPDQFATSTKMNALADAEGFLVLYPGQNAIANPRRCWNWFMPDHQGRGKGEPAALAGLVEAISRTHDVDPRRVYVAGLSAGGAMAAVLGATYPDVFAAVGVCSGLAYGVATTVDGALKAMDHGGAEPGALPARLAAAMGGRKRGVPLMAIHGTKDVRVVPVNAEQLTAQWAAGLGLAATPTEVVQAPALPGTRPVEKALWKDAAGRTVVERWLVTDLAHAWPGGDPAGTHVDAVGPSASEAFWTFFKDRRL
jgi:poly(hydroxyalkanoate) depolymerase family esterase